MKHNDLTRFKDTGTLYLSAPEAAELVRRLGLPHCLQHMAEHIHADFLRWADFDKSARVAAHSKDGVIELMPVADDHRYSFKYVNGHPGNTRLGLSTVMAFGVLADVDTAALRTRDVATGVTARVRIGFVGSMLFRGLPERL